MSSLHFDAIAYADPKQNHMNAGALTAAESATDVPLRMPELRTSAVVLEAPEVLTLQTLDLLPPAADDVIVDVLWSGISSGTERLLYRGTMPPFPGLSYPLVPGYESVGRIVWCGPESGRTTGETVFVPGARCYSAAAGLFGGAARRLVVSGARVVPVPDRLGPDAVLLALAATAQHAMSLVADHRRLLIVGYGVLGRLLERLAAVRPGADPSASVPVVWETNPLRRGDRGPYPVMDPAEDPHTDYSAIIDVSGDAGVLNDLIARLAPGGQVILAGFYDLPLSFDFAPAFMREVTLQVAAQWQQRDLDTVARMAASGELTLQDLITHRAAAGNAASAYRQAFDDAQCLKMILDWRDV